MSYRQVIAPNPHIKCGPGWCLKYVRETFGLPARHPTATAAWNASTSKHRDRNFPAGVWLAVWYALDREPAGHVVLLAPDGSCFSTSDLDDTPHHHPNLADLERFYARYNMRLTYRGWTEDVAGTPVIEPATITAQSTEEYMPTAREVADTILDTPVERAAEMGGKLTLREVIAWYDPNIADAPRRLWSYSNPSGEDPRDAYQVLRDIPRTVPTVVADIPDDIAQEVIDALTERLQR